MLKVKCSYTQKDQAKAEIKIWSPVILKISNQILNRGKAPVPIFINDPEII